MDLERMIEDAEREEPVLKAFTRHLIECREYAQPTHPYLLETGFLLDFYSMTAEVFAAVGRPESMQPYLDELLAYDRHLQERQEETGESLAEAREDVLRDLARAYAILEKKEAALAAALLSISPDAGDAPQPHEFPLQEPLIFEEFKKYAVSKVYVASGFSLGLIQHRVHGTFSHDQKGYVAFTAKEFERWKEKGAEACLEEAKGYALKNASSRTYYKADAELLPLLARAVEAGKRFFTSRSVSYP